MKRTTILRIAVAGLGRIAWQYHLPRIVDDSRFQLVAVADPLPERLVEAREKFAVKSVYRQFSSMLEHEDLDLLVIASPTCFHMEQILQAFAHGVDVICEKPLACSLQDAKKISRARSVEQRKIMIFQPHRLSPEAVTLKTVLESGILGRIFMSRKTYSGFNRRNDWQAFAGYGGGMLNNYGSHFIDQFIFLFGGEFKSVNALLRRLVSEGDAEDFVKLQAVNAHDIILDLEINMANAFPGQTWEICGTCGSALYAPDGWRLRYFKPSQLEARKMQSGLAAEGRSYPEESIPWVNENIPFKNVPCSNFYEHCYRYFALDSQPLVPFEDTMEVMEIMERCRKHEISDTKIKNFAETQIQQGKNE
ncbi:MAG: Gfo/Idh/MocA family oxidoreductase [Victivallaceae bacterium]